MKIIIWRVISILLTLLVTFLVTGDVRSATELTVLLHIVLILAHYCFETAWKKKHEDKDISGW
ncbi:MAG TPA: DUF2061 domain-containing protein [Dehalococcoidia bacterium]|jgi:uncharacterized membrane protein|nr:DUF2061 domain-containing protein [Dehalococcoidia bacterium]